MSTAVQKGQIREAHLLNKSFALAVLRHEQPKKDPLFFLGQLKQHERGLASSLSSSTSNYQWFFVGQLQTTAAADDDRPSYQAFVDFGRQDAFTLFNISTPQFQH